MEKQLKIAVILSAVDKMSKVIDGAVNNGAKSLTRLSKETSKLGDRAFGIGTQAGAIALAVAVPLKMMVDAAEESEIAGRKLEQVFKSMGETTGKAALKAQQFASNLQVEIGVDDENIIAVQTKLATFENVIKNTAGTAEIFERATTAAFDLQAAGFGEATQNATQLGKALQDPVKGITALARSGVTFTAQEKQKIKTLVESGKILEAQRFLMAAIEKQVGGTAKAGVTSSQRIRVAFGEVMETLGKALLPAFDKFAKWFTEKGMPAVQKFIDENGTLVKWLVMGAAALATISAAVAVFAFMFGGVMKIISGGIQVIMYLGKAIQFIGTVFRVVSMALAANPIMAIIMAIALAALLIYNYWDEIKVFFIKLWDAVKNIFMSLFRWWKKTFFDYSPVGLIYNNWSKITAWFAGLWQRVRAVFIALFMWWKKWFFDYSPAVLIYNNWGKIVAWFKDVWDKVIDEFKWFFDFLATLPDRFYTAGQNLIQSIWDGMKKKWTELKAWFKSGIQDLRDMLPFSPAKKGPLKDIHRLKLVETIASNIKPAPMVQAMTKATAAVKATVKAMPLSVSPAKPTPFAGAGGGGTVVNFSPTINASGGAEKTNILGELKKYERELVKIIDNAQARKQRASFA